MNTNQLNTINAIRKQDSSWCHYYNKKLIQPKRPIDRLLKSLGKKTVGEQIQDKTCSSCFKYVSILNMTADHIKEWGISAMCRTCQDNFFLEN